MNTSIIALLIIALNFVGCTGSFTSTSDNGSTGVSSDSNQSYPFEIISSTDKINAEIELVSGDVIELELYPEIAPITVSNFKYLCDKGFYNGLIFHRVIEGFMIQGGCPDGIGTGGPGYHIKGEFIANGVANSLKHERGVISMARAMSPDSAGSQFFIMHETAPHLDGQYAAFGRVTNGMDIVDKIATTETDGSDRPLNDVVIKSIVIK